MKNYEDMSDSQIAQKVFFFLSSNLCPNGGLAHISSDGFFFFDNKNIKRKFDPCNNPSDAWPIIVDNKISLTCHQSRGEWSAVFNTENICFHANNPLRAAMIVFLKMNEDKMI